MSPEGKNILFVHFHVRTEAGHIIQHNTAGSNRFNRVGTGNMEEASNNGIQSGALHGKADGNGSSGRRGKCV